jgi:hypothetical protein
MLDPLTTTTAILAISTRCATIVQDIHDVVQHYKNAPRTIKRIQEEAGAIGGSLAAIILALEFNPRILEAAGLITGFNAIIEECRAVLSRIDTYLAIITAGGQWRQRVRIIWNESELKTLLDELRGKQGSLVLLLQTLNM